MKSRAKHLPHREVALGTGGVMAAQKSGAAPRLCKVLKRIIAHHGAEPHENVSVKAAAYVRDQTLLQMLCM